MEAPCRFIIALAVTPDKAYIILGTCNNIAIWHEGTESTQIFPIEEHPQFLRYTKNIQNIVDLRSYLFRWIIYIFFVAALCLLYIVINR